TWQTLSITGYCNFIHKGSDECVSSYKNDSGVIEEIPTNLIIGRTKAMLFNTIEKLLEDKYGDHMPVIYGMPIVNMDFKHAEKLKEEIRQVDY
ncbi:MAG: hypothetical protein O2887_15830, partial [Bacteroidetes bacterium]|nr:hypothetical protein [Bacteroidota bacterium]MDA1121933.1 hypothetical protein [Bacteroidota bacterium]